MTNNTDPMVEILTLVPPPEPSFEMFLEMCSMLPSIPFDALDQFIEMLQKNFPTALDNVSGL